MKTLWLIPARGGSKGIPDKNIRPFCGESLVSRAIRQARACADAGDIIYVSTDSVKIREEAEHCGIEIPFMRPAELASDTASTWAVIVDTLKKFSETGQEFDNVVLLQPTSPFRTEEDIRKASSLWRHDIDMVVSVTPSKANPYFNLFETDKQGFLHLSKGDGNFSRRQDAPEVWEYNGAVYVITVKSVLKSPLSQFQKILPYVMPGSRSIDLDTLQDWEIAEIIYRAKKKG